MLNTELWPSAPPSRSAAHATCSVQFCLLVFFLILFAAAPAAATWSIVAVDQRTREVGVAGASCIGGSEVIAALVPGRGALVAQAFSNLDGRDLGARMLAKGASPREVLERIAKKDFDSFLWFDTSAWRQYGVVALGAEGEPATFTGRSTLAWSGALRGPGVAVQGNTLYGEEVLERSLKGFLNADGACPATLGDRLVSGLVAGAEAGGDRRCTPELAALSAFVTVAMPEDDPEHPSLRLVVTRKGEGNRCLVSAIFKEIQRNWITPESGTKAENPVHILRRHYRKWRGASGCAKAGPGSLPSVLFEGEN